MMTAMNILRDAGVETHDVRELHHYHYRNPRPDSSPPQQTRWPSMTTTA